MKKILVLATTGAVAVLGVAGMVGLSAQAASPCVITNGTVDIVGDTVCIIGQNVNTININSTTAELGDVLNQYNNDSTLGYATFASGATINANISDEFSTSNVDWLATLAPAGTIAITPGNPNITYTQAPWAVPAGFSINYANTIIHLPTGTTPATAVDVFLGITDDTIIVASGNDYTVSSQFINGVQTPVLHLPENTSVDDALAIAKTITNANIIVALNNNTDFTITVRIGQDPVISYGSTGLTPPATGRH